MLVRIIWDPMTNKFCYSDEAVKGEYTEGGLQPGSATEEGIAIPKPVENSEPITSALACAGHTLEGTQAELVLQPLRLAFEAKNIKLVEPALDCLHVCGSPSPPFLHGSIPTIL